MEKSIAIEAKKLKKHFKGKRGIEEIKAVDGISFRVESGEFFGLLGTNGAGKPGSVRWRRHSLVDWFQPCKYILLFVKRSWGVKGRTMVNHEVYGQIECKSGRRSKVYCDVYCLEMRMKEIAPEDEAVIIEFVERIQ